MADGWLTVVVLLLLVMAAVNAAIFLFAWYEWATSSSKDPWLRSTQILSPTANSARSTAILLHGFGGTPKDFRSLAEVLLAGGFRVVVPAQDSRIRTSTSFAYSRGSFSPTAYAAWLGNLIGEERALSGDTSRASGHVDGWNARHDRRRRSRHQ